MSSEKLPELLNLLEDAKWIAIQHKNYQIDIPHLWYCLLSQKTKIWDLYSRLGIDNPSLFELVEKEVAKIPSISSTTNENYGKQFSQRLNKLLEQAEKEAEDANNTHVSLEDICIALMEQKNNPITVYLRDQSINKSQILDVLGRRQNRKGEEEQESVHYPSLEKYAINLNNLLQHQSTGNMIVGREKEMADIARILSRSTKHHAVLIGPPGTGRRTIVYGFVQKIISQIVPDHLKEMIVYQLDLGALLAGTKYRGEFEERLNGVIRDLLETQGQVVLYIEDIHQIVSAGKTEGAMDAATLLKPYLSNTKLTLLGTSYHAAYRETIEADPSLEKNFQRIIVSESDAQLTMDILNAHKERFEAYHLVTISEESMDAAIQLSRRYLTDRYLPDKALDLLDEACALKKIENRESERKIGKNEIANVVERLTGIKVQGVMESERSRLLNLGKLLKERIIGQDEAVDAVSQVILRSRAGIQNPKRPIGSFLFLGPTGVGKTALAKRLAEVLFGNELEMVRLDMSEYMEKHAVAKLVGPPPGYVGYEEGGQLTEAVRKRLYSIILLDEIEKAHPDVFNMLLQVLDEGRLTDSKGRTIDFKNTLLIMTSNLGSDKILHSLSTKGKLTDEIRKEIIEDLDNHFRPEFLNRIDEVLLFNSLRVEDMMDIVKLMIRDLQMRLSEQKVTLEISNGVYSYLAKKGYQVKFGARPMQRLIQKEIENPLARLLIENGKEKEMKISLTLGKDKLIFSSSFNNNEAI